VRLSPVTLFTAVMRNTGRALVQSDCDGGVVVSAVPAATMGIMFGSQVNASGNYLARFLGQLLLVYPLTLVSSIPMFWAFSNLGWTAISGMESLWQGSAH